MTKSWTRESAADALANSGELGNGTRLHMQAERIINDLIFERDRLREERDEHAVDVNQLHATTTAAVSYRLPEALGGGEIQAQHRPIDLGDRDETTGLMSGLVEHEYRWTLPEDGVVVLHVHDPLVEVRPPSITDPSRWPLEIEHGITKLTLRTARDDDLARGIDEPVAALVANQGTNMAIRVPLSEDDLWELAKSAAQHVMGRRRFDELQAAAGKRAPSKVENGFCPFPGDEYADGPFPFPGDEYAVRLPSGGWIAKAHVDYKHYSRTSPPQIAKVWCDDRKPTEANDGNWYCSIPKTDAHNWHIAIDRHEDAGVVLGVWPNTGGAS